MGASAEVDGVGQPAIVQEGATNVLRHAGLDPTDVELRRVADRIEVEITNRCGSGSPPLAPGSSGRGIDGLRTRVLALGGELEGRRNEDGGFTLRASLPVDG